MQKESVMSEQSNIKRYKVKETWKDYEVTLEVNHAVLTVERAAMINEFWSDQDGRMNAEDGDVVKAVIRLFGQRAINAMLAEGGADFTINFKHVMTGEHPGPYWTADLHGNEGWGGSIPGDPYGWCGIRLIAADVEAVAFDTVELVEVGHEA
jgi:hypothetical protein